MSSREVARRVLRRVAEGSYATLALSGELTRARGLSGPDRRLATELVYGVLKRRRRLDRALAACAPRGIDRLDPITLDALRIAAHQILFLRVPAHAAVDDAVDAIKRLRGVKLAGFVNALLRRLARDGEPPLPPPEAWSPAELGVAESAPDWLVADALARFTPEEARAFLAALNDPAPLWLRVNTLRGSLQETRAALLEERPGARLAGSPLCPEALRAEALEDPFTTRAFVEGRVTVQDLAAQVVGRLARPEAGERILDACAGVGGKATHLAQLSGDRARIDAADLSDRKLELCGDHARRLGLDSVRTVRADLCDPAAPLAATYDRILLDAPCSGLGVLRRHPEAKWRTPDTAGTAELQSRLLDALAPRVRVGGLLVYSVCTYTDEEGPAQLRRLLEARRELRVEPPTEPELAELLDSEGAVHTWPHRHDADAFYAVRLRRIG